MIIPILKNILRAGLSGSYPACSETYLYNNPYLLVQLNTCHCHREVNLHNQCDHHNHPPHQHMVNPGCTWTNQCYQSSNGIDCVQHYILHLCSQSDYCIVLCSIPCLVVQYHSYQYRRQVFHCILNLSDIHPLPLCRLGQYKSDKSCYQILSDNSFCFHRKPSQSSNQCQLCS